MDIVERLFNRGCVHVRGRQQMWLHDNCPLQRDLRFDKNYILTSTYHIAVDKNPIEMTKYLL